MGIAVCAVGLIGCSQPGNSSVKVRTSEVSAPSRISLASTEAESGLVFSFPKQRRPMRTLEAFGCGCAAFDGDNDGWQDVLIIADPFPLLFRNSGTGKFQNLSATSGLSAARGNWMGCAIGDCDGDGLLDILLTGYRQLALYRNKGNFRFELITKEAGLDPGNHQLWSSSAGFMDLDGDQHLDLVLINFVEFGPHVQQFCELKPGIRTGCLPRLYVPQRSEIWRNTGKGGFERVPQENGMDQTTGVGLVLAFSDINRDGRIDFYIGNDGVPSEMMLNEGNMKFRNIGTISGLAYDVRGASPASMGSDWADYDRDGQLDLAISNFQNAGFVVYRNLRDNQFEDSATPTGIHAATKNRLGFGTKWVDLDNDGWPDLVFVNGHVYDNVEEAVGQDVHLRQPIMVLQNHHGTFVDVTPQMSAQVQRTMVGRGSATADFNNDGRMDLLAIDFEGPLMLLENRTATENHWITLDLRGQAPNPFAYGALVTAKAGDEVWIAEVSPASSYLSSSDPRIHWGLGAVTKLDEISIRWPSGGTQKLKDVGVDRIMEVKQESAK